MTETSNDSRRPTADPSTEEPLYLIRPEDCTESSRLVFSSLRGTIVLDKSRAVRQAMVCQWTVSVPPGLFLTVTLQRLETDGKKILEGWPSHSGLVVLHEDGALALGSFVGGGQQQHHHHHPQLASLSNVLHFRLFSDRRRDVYLPLLRLRYEATSGPTFPRMEVVLHESRSRGSVAFAGGAGADSGAAFGPRDFLNSLHALTLPTDDSVVLVTFSHFLTTDVDATPDCESEFLRVYAVVSDDDGGASPSRRLLQSYCGRLSVPAKVYSSSLVLVYHRRPSLGEASSGFRLLFSFHPRRSVPSCAGGSGLLACDTPVYPTFRDHVACNHVTECQRGEDEAPGRCPRSSQACRGAARYDSTCYAYRAGRNVSWSGAAAECRRSGSGLAVFPTAGRLTSVKDLVSRGKRVTEVGHT